MQETAAIIPPNSKAIRSSLDGHFRMFTIDMLVTLLLWTIRYVASGL